MITGTVRRLQVCPLMGSTGRQSRSRVVDSQGWTGILGPRERKCRLASESGSADWLQLQPTFWPGLLPGIMRHDAHTSLCCGPLLTCALCRKYLANMVHIFGELCLKGVQQLENAATSRTPV